MHLPVRWWPKSYLKTEQLLLLEGPSSGSGLELYWDYGWTNPMRLLRYVGQFSSPQDTTGDIHLMAWITSFTFHL